MSVTMVEAFDAPMIDFNEDTDVPMAGSSTDNWFQQNLSNMEEDPVEIDMMIYNDTAEYEMGDDLVDTEVEVSADASAVDAEVYDATIHPSPIPAVPEVDLSLHDGEAIPALPDEAALPQEHAPTITVESAVVPAQQIVHVTPGTGYQGNMPEAVTGSDIHAEGLSSLEGDSTAHVAQHVIEHNAATVEVTQIPDDGEASSKEISNGNETPTIGDSEQAVPKTQHEEQRSTSRAHSVAPSNHANDYEVVVTINEKPIESSHDFTEREDTTASTALATVETGYEQSAEHVYTEPPPPVSLTLRLASNEGDQPEFALFTAPETVAGAEGDGTPAEEPLVLLQHNPSLFYEPITTVFEAFRREEYFTHIEELSEAEMAIDAHDLQLVISEDNIYSREVSLHDLYAMHQGVGLPGHLKLTLQSIVPRFISRYNHLRDQITRLAITDEGEDSQQSHKSEEYISQEHVKESTEDAEAEEVIQDLHTEEAYDTSHEEGNFEQDDTADYENQHSSEKSAEIQQAAGTAQDQDHDVENTEDDAEEAPVGILSQQAEAHNLEIPSLEDRPALERTGEEGIISDKESKREAISEEIDRDDGVFLVEEQGAHEDENEHEGEADHAERDEPVEPEQSELQDDVGGEERVGEHPPLEGSSHSISTSVSQGSYETEDSIEADALWEAVDGQEGEEALYDGDAPELEGEEANEAENVEADEYEYEGDDFDASTEEDPLEDSAENEPGVAEAAAEAASSEAVLRDSEKFVNDLANTEFDPNTVVEPEPSKNSTVVEEDSESLEEPVIRHKTSGKRSLRDTSLEDDDDESPPSSPGSKRSRLQ